MKTIIVTGGAGFIGSHIVDELIKLGFQQANLDKSEFLAFVSHELRNPLGAISSLSEILVENNQKPKLTKQDLKENSEISKLINESSSDCLRLLSDLIDVAKSPKDGFAINKKPDVDICHIINLFSRYT